MNDDELMIAGAIDQQAPIRIGVIGADLGRRGALIVAALSAHGQIVELVRLDQEIRKRTQVTGVWFDECEEIPEGNWNALHQCWDMRAFDPPDVPASRLERKPKQETRWYRDHAREASRQHSQAARNAMKRGRR